MDGEQGKGLWIEHWEEEACSIGSTSGAQIGVIAKVFCISRSVPRKKKQNVLLSFFLRLLPVFVNRRSEHICEFFHDLDLPVGVSKSDTLVNFVDHWFQLCRPIYQTTVILDAAVTLVFTIVSLMFEPPDEIGESRSDSLSILICTSALLRSYGTVFTSGLFKGQQPLVSCSSSYSMRWMGVGSASR